MVEYKHNKIFKQTKVSNLLLQVLHSHTTHHALCPSKILKCPHTYYTWSNDSIMIQLTETYWTILTEKNIFDLKMPSYITNHVTSYITNLPVYQPAGT